MSRSRADSSAAVLCEPDSASLASRVSAVNLDLLLAAVLTLCVVRLWLMPLPSSFWVDEMVTSFVVRHGAANPSLGVAPQVAASLYYGLPSIAEKLFGFSEIVYRAPSVLAMALALFLIFRIARTLIHPDAGWFAAYACLALRGFNYQAADARPYALGTCVACASLWLLIRWLDSARWSDALLFVSMASLLWRVHLIFWPLYLVFAVYLVVRLGRAETRVGWLRAVAVFALLGLSLVPVLVTALALYREAGAHVIAQVPSPADLINSLKLGLITSTCAGASLFNRCFAWPRSRHSTSWGALALILGWWLGHPLCLFAFSRLTGNSVFVPRYLYIALPGAAFAATAVAGLFIPSVRWKQLSVVLGLGVLLFLGQWHHPWPAHDGSDWRTAARRLREQSLGPDAPVICPSPFIEARPPAWRPDYPLPGFLYAHLLTYPIQGKPHPFPFESSPEAEDFAARLSKETLAVSERFALYGGERSVLFWRNWFAARPELAAWRSRRLGPFGEVEVVVFEKQMIRPSSFPKTEVAASGPVPSLTLPLFRLSTP